MQCKEQGARTVHTPTGGKAKYRHGCRRDATELEVEKKEVFL